MAEDQAKVGTTAERGRGGRAYDRFPELPDDAAGDPVPGVYHVSRETLTLLKDAAREIRELRQRNAVLQQQAMTVEAFHRALCAEPPRQGQAVDLAWELDNAVLQLALGAEGAGKPAL